MDWVYLPGKETAQTNICVVSSELCTSKIGIFHCWTIPRFGIYSNSVIEMVQRRSRLVTRREEQSQYKRVTQ